MEPGEREGNLQDLAGPWLEQQHLRLPACKPPRIHGELPTQPVVAERARARSELRERLRDQRLTTRPGPFIMQPVNAVLEAAPGEPGSKLGNSYSRTRPRRRTASRSYDPHPCQAGSHRPRCGTPTPPMSPHARPETPPDLPAGPPRSASRPSNPQRQFARDSSPASTSGTAIHRHSPWLCLLRQRRRNDPHLVITNGTCT